MGGGALPKSASLNSLFIAHSVIFAFLFTYSVPKIKTELKLLLYLNISENKLLLKILEELLCSLNLKCVDPSNLTITQLATNK